MLILTQDQLPQLQDLGLYIPPPTFTSVVFVYSKLQQGMNTCTKAHNYYCPKVSQYLSEFMNIARVPYPLVAQTCTHKIQPKARKKGDQMETG